MIEQHVALDETRVGGDHAAEGELDNVTWHHPC